MYASETMDATNNNYSNNHTKKKSFGEHADSVHQYGNAEQVQIDSQGQYTSKNSKVVDAKKMQVKDKIGLQSVTTHNESILPNSSNDMISGQDYDMDNTMKHFTPCRKVTRTSTERKRSLNNTRTFKCVAGNDLELNINISCKREDNSNITKKEEVSHVSTRTDTKTDNNSNSKDLIHVSDKKKSIAGDGTKCVKDIKLLSKDLDRDILTKANSKCCEIQANFSNDNGLKGVKKTKMRFKRMKSSVSDSDKRSINIQPPPNMHTDDKCERDENTKSISMKNNSCDGTNDLTCNDDDSCENTVDTKLKPAEYLNSTTKLSNHLTYHTDDVKSETENTSLEDVKRPLVDLKENKLIESDSDDEKQSNKMQSTVNECLHSTIEDGHIPKQTLGKFTCHLCSKGFSQSCNLKKHMILHTGERPFSCEICEKKFSQAAHLKTHARSHTGEKPYKCDVCGKHFGQSSNLKTHLRTHLCEKPFICLFCDKMFTREEHVKNHMRIHTGEKPYTCTICEKEFTQEAHLKRHLRTHTGERPYTCLTCNKGFTEDGTLKVHMRIHTGERPFICRFCGKGFRDSSNLRRHVGSHTGERAFVCQICDKKYAKKVTLRKHMTTNHSNITEESAVNRLIAQVCETYNEETKALNDARKHSDDETVVNGFLEEADDTDVADTTESEVIEETTQSFTSTDDGHESSDNQETLREDISLTTDVVIKLESVDNEYI